MLFYIPVMLADLFPWSFMIPLALWWAVRDERQDRVARLLVVWIAAIVVFFSLSGTKEDLYILPIVPAEAALIGAMLAKAIEGASRPVAWFAGATAMLLAVTGRRRCGSSRLRTAIRWTARRSSARRRLVGRHRRARVAASRVLFSRLSRRMAREPRRHRVVHRALHAARFRALQTGEAVLRDHSLARERRRHRRLVQVRAAEHGLLPAPARSWRSCFPIIFARCSTRAATCISSWPKIEYNSVKDRLPVETYVLARQPMFDLRPKNFIDGSELPQFVLVSNRD